jgi:hypothetical protein
VIRYLLAIGLHTLPERCSFFVAQRKGTLPQSVANANIVVFWCWRSVLWTDSRAQGGQRTSDSHYRLGAVISITIFRGVGQFTKAFSAEFCLEKAAC